MSNRKKYDEALDWLYSLSVSCREEVHEHRSSFLGEKYNLIKQLINEHFDNPPFKCEERVKFLEKQLDIAIKELCIDAKGADACNSLDVLYEGIRERIMEQARKEVQE